MDDKRGGGALAGGFLELVGPAAVVGHGLAVKELRVVGDEAGVVHEHDDGFALHVETGVVVPVGFRRNDAIADEDEIRVSEGDRGVGLVLGDEDGVGAELEIPALAFGAGNFERRGGGVDGLCNHLDLLEVGAVRVAGGKARAGEFVGDPLGRGFAGDSARAAAFVLVVGQFLDARAEVGGRDFGCCCELGADRAGGRSRLSGRGRFAAAASKKNGQHACRRQNSNFHPELPRLRGTLSADRQGARGGNVRGARSKNKRASTVRRWLFQDRLNFPDLRPSNSFGSLDQRGWRGAVPGGLKFLRQLSHSAP